MHYILFYKTVDDYIERRATYREEHLRLAREASTIGSLIMAGAFADPADGAALIFESDTPDVARNFAESDPYVKNGLILEWWIRPWNVVAGCRQQ